MSDPYNDENLWVDFAEGELEDSLKEDLELLRKHSPTHQKILEGVENVKAAVRSTDDEEIPQDGNYYLELHDRIMLEVNKAQTAPAKRKLFDFKKFTQRP